MKKYKYWTQEEISKMIDLYSKYALPPWAISERLDRTLKSVQCKLKELREKSLIKSRKEVEKDYEEYLCSILPDDLPIDK